MRIFCLVSLFAISILLTGCGSTPTNEAPENQAPVQAVSPIPYKTPPTDEQAGDTGFEGTAAKTEKKNPQMTGIAVLSEVRTARHESYDRLVFEFGGNELPGYHVEYIDKPVRACGSGDEVPFQGDGWLQVRFSNAQAHNDQGATIRDRARSPNLPIIRDLKITCDFEAEVIWVAGVSSPNKFRILELKSPTRLVVDINHK